MKKKNMSIQSTLPLIQLTFWPTNVLFCFALPASLPQRGWQSSTSANRKLHIEHNIYRVAGNLPESLRMETSCWIHKQATVGYLYLSGNHIEMLKKSMLGHTPTEFNSITV